MHSRNWSDVLTRLPAHLKSLREGADEATLRRLEARIGGPLPAPYRGFLHYADGGWIGDRRIYGTPELGALLETESAVSLRRRTDTVGRRRPRRLLPFHPVDSCSVECLDLDRPDGPVVWCDRVDRACRERTAAERFDIVHPIARDIISGRVRSLSTHDTYEDFLDWGLDVVFELHFPWTGLASPELVLAQD